VEPDVIEPATGAGDRLLLCTDGLVADLEDDEITSVLRSVDDPGAAATALVRLATARGGADNVSVVVIDIADGAGTP
jgi:protein phosphatase